MNTDTKVAHTPGPWEVKLEAHFSEGRPSAGVWVRAEDGAISIANLVPHSGVEGNANLIAAAPEMLAALKLAAPEFCSLRCPSVFKSENEPRHIRECEQLRAAIAKAEGI